MDTLTHGFEGVESDLENAVNNRGVTLAEHYKTVIILTLNIRYGG